MNLYMHVGLLEARPLKKMTGCEGDFSFTCFDYLEKRFLMKKCGLHIMVLSASEKETAQDSAE